MARPLCGGERIQGGGLLAVDGKWRYFCRAGPAEPTKLLLRDHGQCRDGIWIGRISWLRWIQIVAPAADGRRRERGGCVVRGYNVPPRLAELQLRRPGSAGKKGSGSHPAVGPEVSRQRRMALFSRLYAGNGSLVSDRVAVRDADSYFGTGAGSGHGMQKGRKQ